VYDIVSVIKLSLYLQ